MNSAEKPKRVLDSSSWESLLKLVPVLIQGYPNLAGMFSQLLGIPADNTTSLQEAWVMPTLTDTIS